MRITELLDKRSVSLSGAPKNKSEALDQVVELICIRYGGYCCRKLRYHGGGYGGRYDTSLRHCPCNSSL